MKKIGIAFAGGGGRGAYQIGIWRALREAGLENYVSVVSGTSVGGLNAALFVQGDYEKAERTWKNISQDKILDIRKKYDSVEKGLADIRKTKGIRIAERGGLIKIIQDTLDMSVFDESPVECYITCLRIKEERAGKETYSRLAEVDFPTEKILRKGNAEYFNMKKCIDTERLSILLATSAIPFVFPREKIGRYYYVDGGARINRDSDNVPVRPLYAAGCDFIVTMPLAENSLPVDVSLFPGADILEIRPRKSLGGILNFSAENAMRLMEEGYSDTIEAFEKSAELIQKLNSMNERMENAVAKETEFLRESAELDWRIEQKMKYIDKRWGKKS